MIAIPNMEKPKDCSECILADKHLNGLCEAKYYCRLEADNCPLIEIVRCGECKYFNLNEWDETICGVPIIVAHEICHKWGDGCKTNIYGFCFMGERRADEHTDKRD